MSDDTDREREREREQADTEAESDGETASDTDRSGDAVNGVDSGDAPTERTDDVEAAAEEFEPETYEEVDADEVLEAGESADEEAPPVSESAIAEVGSESEVETETEPEPDAAVNVIESRVCQNCPYFGDPPELHCTHEGTEIREMLDLDHYVVVDCPVVADELDF